MKKTYPSITLLNSEGPLLTAMKIEDNKFVIYDREDGIVEILSFEDIYNFIHGQIELFDALGNTWRYTKYPGSMKPDLKELDEFIGINTTGKIY